MGVYVHKIHIHVHTLDISKTVLKKSLLFYINQYWVDKVNTLWIKIGLFL